MFLEIAQIDIKKGMEEQFETKVAEAMPLFRRAKGCRSMELHRSSELAGRYRLFVEWETLENHTVDFRQSDDFTDFASTVASVKSNSADAGSSIFATSAANSERTPALIHPTLNACHPFISESVLFSHLLAATGLRNLP